MAAWLAYLESRLLLPRESAGDDQPSGEELAARLAFPPAKARGRCAGPRRL